jgi:hypothetical protein
VIFSRSVSIIRCLFFKIPFSFGVLRLDDVMRCLFFKIPFCFGVLRLDDVMRYLFFEIPFSFGPPGLYYVMRYYLDMKNKIELFGNFKFPQAEPSLGLVQPTSA